MVDYANFFRRSFKVFYDRQFIFGFVAGFIGVTITFYFGDFSTNALHNCNTYAPAWVHVGSILFGVVIVYRGYRNNDFIFTFFGICVAQLHLLQYLLLGVSR